MTPPYRARFGAKDNRHDLLAWDGPDKVPSRLYALTDQPPGHLGPGQSWWPAVGCGPVEGGWALWWTMPDPTARRAGMVCSDVAFWPADVIGQVDDLRPILHALSGEALSAVDDGLVGAVAEALLSGEEPQVLSDLQAWPAVLATLWPRFWPSLRRVFAGRVVLDPPQGGYLEVPHLLVSPNERIQRWPESRRVRPRDQTALRRSARWLMGRSDATMDELLSLGFTLTADVRSLDRIARTADRVDGMRAAPSMQSALNVLRTLTTSASPRDRSGTLEREAIALLSRVMPAATPEDVVLLCNIDVAALPDEAALGEALKIWTEQHGATLDPMAARALLGGRPALPWWREAVDAGFRRRLGRLDTHWARAALRWLTEPICRQGLRSLLPDEAGVEAQLLTAFNADASLAGEALLTEARTRGWSQLHAHAALRALPAAAALQAQRTFPRDDNPGLAIVVDAVPGHVAVAQAVDAGGADILALVARRTAREPELLAELDLTHAGWLALWLAHIDAGGVRWPSETGIDELRNQVLTIALDGHLPSRLLEHLAPDLGPAALHRRHRASLWKAVHGPARRALLDATAAALIDTCHTRLPEQPERPLAEAVVDRMRRERVSPRAVAMALGWDVTIQEADAIRWLKTGSNQDWRAVAELVGAAINRRAWKEAADTLFWRWHWDQPLRAGLRACASLFPAYRRVLLYEYKASPASDAQEIAPLLERIASLGADLVPDGLSELWERVGGKRKNLSGASPAARWREAVRLAHQGAISGGLPALVSALRDERPHNKDLRELEGLLRATPPER